MKVHCFCLNMIFKYLKDAKDIYFLIIVKHNV